MSPSYKKISVFILLTFVFSSIFYALIISSGNVHPFSLFLMWCPGVAALLTQFIFQRNLSGLGWRRGSLRFWLAGYGLPLLYGGLIYGIAWLSGLQQFIPLDMARRAAVQLNFHTQNPTLFLIIYLVILAVFGMLISSLSALGEEIGWRGFLVAELSKNTSFTKTALISGAVWAIWHYPTILFSDYKNPDIPLWFQLVCFTVSVLGLSFAFAWLRLKSNSLWPAVILHASHNLFIQSVFDAMTGNTMSGTYWTTEFGAGLALAAVLIAFYFWRKRSELPLPTTVG